MCYLFGHDTVPTTDDVQSLPMTTGSGRRRVKLLGGTTTMWGCHSVAAMSASRYVAPSANDMGE
jgi:hypothetical protein